MNTYRIAVVDDEAAEREKEKQYLERYQGSSDVSFDLSFFTSAEELLNNYTGAYDLLLLDIRMGGMDGMQAAQKIRKKDPRVCMIFITTMTEMAIEGYKVHAYGFMRKPMIYAEFSHELKGALEHIDFIRRTENYIAVKDRGSIRRIPVSSILYIEVSNHDLFIHMKEEVVKLRGRITDMEEQLKGYGFLRPHVAFLINGNYISGYDDNEIRLKNNETIPVAKGRRKEFVNELMKFIQEGAWT